MICASSQATAPPDIAGGTIDCAKQISTDRQPPCRGRCFRRMRRRRYGMRDRQLEHAHPLPFAEQGHQHMASIRKFDRVVVTIVNMRVNGVELSDTEIDRTGPDPAVVVS